MHSTIESMGMDNSTIKRELMYILVRSQRLSTEAFLESPGTEHTQEPNPYFHSGYIGAYRSRLFVADIAFALMKATYVLIDLKHSRGSWGILSLSVLLSFHADKREEYPRISLGRYVWGWLSVKSTWFVNLTAVKAFRPERSCQAHWRRISICSIRLRSRHSKIRVTRESRRWITK